MKSFKKLLAVMLSLMMIASVVVLPASAEGEETTTETVTRTYNLLDMSDHEVGAFNGTYPEGVSKLTAWRQCNGENAYFDGGINVVKNASDKNVLQLDLSTATFNRSAKHTRFTESGGIGTVYKLKLNIPTKLLPYVKNVSMNLDKQTSGGIVYNLGFMGYKNSDSTVRYSKPGSCDVYSIDYATTGIVNKTVAPENIYITDEYGSGGAYGEVSDTSPKWRGSEDTFTMTSAWLILSAYGNGSTEVDGYVNIEDISVTVEADPDILDAYTASYSIFDLSEATVGETVSGSASSLPSGLSVVGINRFTEGIYGVGYHTGSQQIVKSGGKKALKVNFDVASKQKDQFGYGASGVYGLTVNVPSGYIPYVTGINITLDNATAGGLAYRFGVTNGEKYGFVKANGYETATKGNDVVISKNLSDLNTYAKSGTTSAIYMATNNGTSEGKWADLGLETTKLVLFMTGQDTENLTGYAVIKDISLELTASQRQFDAMPITKRINLLDMSNHTVGEFNGIYPVGASKMTAWESNYAFYDGDINVVENSVGKKVLQLDLSTATFNSTEKGQGRIFGDNHKMTTIYKLKLDIPAPYLDYVDSVSANLDKQTSGGIVYDLGVMGYKGTNTTDYRYSRSGESGNDYIAPATTGIVTNTVKPENLYVAGSWQSGGAWGSTSGNAKWRDSGNNVTMTGAWFVLTAHGNGTTEVDGYVNIEDITITATATAAEWAAADAEIAKNKDLVNDFETTGTEVTEGAVSGTKVKVLTGGAWSGHSVAINTNPNIINAKGFSFWVYNPGEAAAKPKIWISTSDTRFIYSTEYAIPAKSYKKISIDFSALYAWAGGDGDTTIGAKTALTAVQIAELKSFTLYYRGQTTLYVDDVYLDFKGSVSNDTFEADTVTGAEIVDGKIKIPASASAQTIAISVPAGTFTDASSFTYKLENHASTAAQLKFYTNATTDEGETTGIIKMGEAVWQYSIGAGATMDHVFNFYGGNAGHTCVRINNNGWYLTNHMSITSIHPSASEKASITKVYLAVNAFGTVDADEYITLDPNFPVVNEGVKVKATTNDSAFGTVSVLKSRVFSGSQGQVTFTPAEKCYLEEVTAVDSLGRDVAIAPVGGSNVNLLYQFTAPAADVTVYATFAERPSTVVYTTGEYISDKVYADFNIPLSKGQVYDKGNDVFTDFKDYGVIYTSKEAIDKYGIAVEDLTYDYVKELQASKHNLADYLYLLDGKDAVKTIENDDNIMFNVDITNVTADLRDKNVVIVPYVIATDADGADYTISEPFDGTLDYYFYGEGLVTEFDAVKGINYEADREADISVWQDIFNQGFDHIRLPMYLANQLGEDGTINEAYLLKVDTAVTNALRSGFSVVLDLHSSVDISGDYAANEAKFISIWNQLATRYAGLPDSVAFELVNEPNAEVVATGTQMSYDQLMSLQRTVTNNIRAIAGNANRKVVVGAKTNGYGTVARSYLADLLDLGNLIVDFHFYEPMSFTHSGADWTDEDYAAGATDYSEADFTQFNEMVELVDGYDAIAWIGEWGAYNPDATAKVSYYTDFATVAREAGIAWSLWEYGQGWSIYKNGAWNEDLLAAVIDN